MTGTAIDQRTGQPILVGSMPTSAQVTAQRKAQLEAERRDQAALIAHLEEAFAPQMTRDGVVDQRRLTSVVAAEVARLSLRPAGTANAVASFRHAAAVKPNAKAEKQLAAELEAATLEARGRLTEFVQRCAWMHNDVLATKATEVWLQEAIDDLTAIETRHHLGIDLGRWVRLPGDCAAIAGQRLRMEGIDASKAYLPALDQALQLPAELRAPATVARPEIDQHHTVNTAMGSVPSSRNPDGTIAGSMPVNPGPVPRSEAEDRKRRREIAAAIAIEDGAHEPA